MLPKDIAAVRLKAKSKEELFQGLGASTSLMHLLRDRLFTAQMQKQSDSEPHFDMHLFLATSSRRTPGLALTLFLLPTSSSLSAQEELKMPGTSPNTVFKLPGQERGLHQAP